MRKLPTVLAFGFIIITLWRVGQFADARMVAGWTGWIFSVIVGIGVYASAYYTRDGITVKDNGKEDARSVNVKKSAWALLVFCVLGDGLFNMAEVWYTVKPEFALSNWLLVLSTAVFGLFPTIAAAGFGALQGHVDRLPTPPAKVSVWLSIRRAVVAKIETMYKPMETEHKPESKPAPVVDKPKPELETLGTRLKIAAAVRIDPGIKNAVLARELGITPQAVGKHRKALERIAVDSRSNGKAHAAQH